jgi:D-tyrosyl-tRNA(Tyr) deacylase
MVSLNEYVMRTVIQRVHQAQVIVDGKVVGKIGRGLLVFLGIEKSDTGTDLTWLVDKIPGIRCFEDENGKMNKSLMDIEGDVMVISQFTLYGSLRKGTRPSFNKAADPKQAIPLYEAFVSRMETKTGRPVATGMFGAEMHIPADNDGPVTLILDTRNKDF